MGCRGSRDDQLARESAAPWRQESSAPQALELARVVGAHVNKSARKQIKADSKDLQKAIDDATGSSAAS